MMLQTQCPRCPRVLQAVGNPGPVLELAHEQQVQDHAVEHARDGQGGAMTELLGLERGRLYAAPAGTGPPRARRRR
jgi:hypothetical protein